MRVVALISGGKDSCYNAMQCIAAGHKIVALANVWPKRRTEIDSYMYQSVGFEAIEYVAEAMELPLFRIETDGETESKGKDYVPDDNDEVEDLYKLLSKVKQELDVDAVSCGAILSDYQRIRVENVCSRLGLISLAYMWQRQQEELLDEMIKCEIDAIVVKVAALGLEPSRHLGRSIRLLEPHLVAMRHKFGLNVCGEGGEYETLTLDCPLYKSRIVIEESETVISSKGPIAPVGYLKLKKLRLDLKLPQLDLTGRFAGLPLRDCNGYVPEAEDDVMEGNAVAMARTEICSSDIVQVPNLGKSGDGWLWIGGIMGQSTKSASEGFKIAMEKLKSSLKEANHRLEDLCSISLYVSDMSQYAELNKIYCETVGHANPPTRACVQVPLPPDCPVILEAISWNSPARSLTGDNRVDRVTMHVQSISHWSPANIGPYSQAVKIDDLIHIAGQISLIPGNMEMVAGGIHAQCQLSLRHVERLIRGIQYNSGLRDVVQGICYLTHPKYITYARKHWESRTNNAIMEYIIVSGLPRNALVEWHVWLHSHNHQFEFEETGRTVQDWSISVFRRWNYENNHAAIFCHVDNADYNATLSAAIFREAIEYVLQKLNQGHDYDPNSVCALRVFFPIDKHTCFHSFVGILQEIRHTSKLVYTVIPVVALGSKKTFLSVSGVRTQ